MNKEWKELKIDNLPSDILTGDYEFNISSKNNNDDLQAKINERSNGWCSMADVHNVIGELFNGNLDIRYRKPEPLPPTHEEIMTLWWLGKCDVWHRVIGYKHWFGEAEYLIGGDWEKRNVFTNREAAVIPPEAEK